MRRVVKIVLIGLVGLVIAAAVGGFVAYKALVYTVNINEYPTLADLPLYSWARVDLSDQTQCSDGSAYYIYVRRGTSSNLIVHFSGGGAAWDAETSANPISITHFDGFYFPFIWEIAHTLLDGIIQHDNAANPFRDWNVVYIPYCTADFDIGAASPSYTADGRTFTIQHNGRQNVTEALDWVYKTFDQPDKLLISGESAGGFATVFWTPTLAGHYASSTIYQLADGVYLETPLWPEIVNDVWQADTEEHFGLTVGDDIAADAFLHDSQQAAPQVTYLHINTAYDRTLIFFNAKLNGVPNDAAYRDRWSQGLRASMQRLADQAPNYSFYLTDYSLEAQSGLTLHTSIATPSFYQVTQDGVSLVDWLERIVIADERFSVGARLMP